MSKIRVLLADDQALLVAALSTILNAQEDIEVVPPRTPATKPLPRR